MQHEPLLLTATPADFSAPSFEAKAPPLNVADLKSAPEEVAMYHRALVIHCSLLLAVMVLAHYGQIAVWVMFVANVALYPEIYLRMHDIGHGCARNRYGWIARFPAVASAIWGGTRVFAMVHREHHQHLGTDRDPWLPYYTGHPLRALFFNFIEPEYSFIQFLRLYGFDRELAVNILFNVGFLAAGFTLFPHTFLLHVVSLRVVHAIGIFFFNFFPHRETLSGNAAIGNWERESALRSALPFLRRIWGADAVDGLVFHNRHHCLGQQHVPVQKYKYLADTGAYTHHHDHWPITSIKKTR
jgi:hypothetical protein